MVSNIRGVLLAVALLIPGVALGADYYVRTDGSDSCNGRVDSAAVPSNDCAFKTINKANTVVGCGNTINIAPGDFYETPKITVSNLCEVGQEKVFQGSGKGITNFFATLAPINAEACVAEGAGWRCPVPPAFNTSTAHLPEYCFMQRESSAVRFLDSNGTKGDMSGPVCVSWNDTGAADLAEGQVFYDASNPSFVIRGWNSFTPIQGKYLVPTYYRFQSGADGPLKLDGAGITVRDLSIYTSGGVSISSAGDRISVQNVNSFGGMMWFDGRTSDISLIDVGIYNAYRRPKNNSTPTAWGSQGSQVLSIQSNGFQINNLETYAAREGIGITGASNGVIDGLFAHGHHNHIFKFIDDAHDIVIRNVLVYNGQEPIFIECARNLSFENVTAPFSSVVIQGRPDRQCANGMANLDFHNMAVCGIHYFYYGGGTNAWAAGGHDLDYNVYMSDYATCYQNSYIIGAGYNSTTGQSNKFANLDAWRAWNGGECPTCTRDPNSIMSKVNDEWVNYKHRDDTIPQNYSFDLKAGAKAINLGNPSWGGTKDIEGNPRISRPDAGAFEGPNVGSEPICGDDLLGPGEVCDGTNLNNQTCITQGFDGGVLSCLPDCSGFNTSQCWNNDPAPGIATPGRADKALLYPDCKEHFCSDDTLGVLDNQGIVWDPIATATYYEIWKIEDTTTPITNASLCTTTSETRFSLIGSQCYSRPSPFRLKVLACLTNPDGSKLCADWDQSPSAGFLLFGCFRQTQAISGPNSTDFQTCEEPCYSGAFDVLPSVNTCQ